MTVLKTVVLGSEVAPDIEFGTVYRTKDGGHVFLVGGRQPSDVARSCYADGDWLISLETREDREKVYQELGLVAMDSVTFTVRGR